MAMRDQYRQGMSISAVSRETGGTGRRFTRSSRPRRPGRTMGRPGLAAPTPRPLPRYIRQRTREGYWNSVVVFDEIRAQGYPGGLTLVRAFIAGLRPARTPVGVMRYETSAGRQAPCDWAAFGETVDPEGTVRQRWAFVYTLSDSRCLYVEFVRDTTQDTLLACLEHAFAAFGGVPEEILSDNMPPMVLQHPRGGPVTWHARFLDFARFPGFVPKAAEAYRAQTKGQAERPTRLAHLPYHQTLETFDFAFPPSLDERQVRELATLPWVDAAAHRAALDPPGVGKTPWLVALAIAAIHARHSVYFVTVQDLVADWRKAWHENRFPQRLAVYTRPSFCVSTKSGTWPSTGRTPIDSSAWSVPGTKRVAGRSRPTKASASGAGDPVLATAILDRRLHHATILNIRGESYRLQDKKRAGTWAGPPAGSAGPTALRAPGPEADLTPGVTQEV